MSVAPSFDLMLFYEKTALVCVHTSDCSLGRDGFRSMVLCENHPCSCSSIFLLLQLAHQHDQSQRKQQDRKDRQFEGEVQERACQFQPAQQEGKDAKYGRKASGGTPCQ